MKLHYLMPLLGLWLSTLALAAETPRAFVAGSYPQILASHPQRPLLIAFWSLDCAHCLEELPRLGDWAARHPQAVVVLVSTDTPELAQAITAALRRHGLDARESWVFADDMPERLRHEIDPRWRGELPRTVLRGRDGTVHTVVGRLAQDELNRWIEAQATSTMRP